jgi:putative FmdB family regulatory protein
MPIYAYKCGSCGHAKDVLQKISDPALSTCPACGAESFSKQITAAGFQLKGSGWYATDFRGGNNGSPPKSEDKPAESGKGDTSKGDTSKGDTSKADTSKGDTGKSDTGKGGSGKTESAPAPAKPDAPAAAGGGCGGSCACH